MRSELESVLTAARTLPTEELPEFLGEVEQIRVTALARISAPVIAQATPDAPLNINEASARLGLSVSYLYRHASRFGFAKRVGRALRFSSNGIENYIRRR